MLYTNVRAFEGGLQDWKDRGHAIVNAEADAVKASGSYLFNRGVLVSLSYNRRPYGSPFMAL